MPITVTPRGAGAGYKVYAALLTQSGTDAPVATVLQNTLGGTVVWSYNGVGTYGAALAGAFPTGKVPKLTTRFDIASAFFTEIDPSYNPPDAIQVISRTVDDKADDLLSNTFIEIRVYP